jgi:hypothetical protein
MLVQSFEDSILLLPAWPKNWSVKFKLHLPKKTVVEGFVDQGIMKSFEITPSNRKKDIKTEQ